MRDKIIIFGASIFPRDLCAIIKAENEIDVVAFTQHREYITDTEIDGLPVIPFEDINEYYSPSECQILNALGYTNMNQTREKVFFEIKDKGYKNYTFISKTATVYSDNIGEGCIIDVRAHIGPCVTLGNGNIIGPDTFLSHRINVGNFNFFSTSVKCAGVVDITDNCYCGIGSVLNNGITLAPKTFIGAASYMTISSEENRTYVGNPAKQIKAKSIIVSNMIGEHV